MGPHSRRPYVLPIASKIFLETDQLSLQLQHLAKLTGPAYREPFENMPRPCLCSTTLLRNFIQSITQVEIPVPSAARTLKRTLSVADRRHPFSHRSTIASASITWAHGRAFATSSSTAAAGDGDAKGPSKQQSHDRTSKTSSKSASKSKTTSTSPTAKPRPAWAVQKAALAAKFPEGWKPIRRLSPDAMDGIRALHAQMPDVYTTATLANQFRVSPEAIRRILRSKWRPKTPEEEARRLERWRRRGERVRTWRREVVGFEEGVEDADDEADVEGGAGSANGQRDPVRTTGRRRDRKDKWDGMDFVDEEEDEWGEGLTLGWGGKRSRGRR